MYSVEDMMGPEAVIFPGFPPSTPTQSNHRSVRLARRLGGAKAHARWVTDCHELFQYVSICLRCIQVCFWKTATFLCGLEMAPFPFAHRTEVGRRKNCLVTSVLIFDYVTNPFTWFPSTLMTFVPKALDDLDGCTGRNGTSFGYGVALCSKPPRITSPLLRKYIISRKYIKYIEGPHVLWIPC